MFNFIKSLFPSFFEKNEVIKEPKKQEVEVKDHKTYISGHAKKRFEERHGVLFSDAQAKSIVEDIISKKAQFVKENPGETEQWIAEYDGKKYRVIYSTENELIVTVYSGIKNKKRKPNRRKKTRADNGKKGKSLDRKPRPVAYKRNKRIVYEESL